MEKLEEKLSQEREGHMKIKKQVENKEKEFTNIQRDLDKLKEIYENKIKLLSSRINKDEGNLNEIKEDIDGKNEVRC